MARMLITRILVSVTSLWPTPALARGVLYFSDVFKGGFDEGSIKRMGTDGTGQHTIVCTGGGVRGIAVDPIAGKLYWTDVEDSVIRRANLDGTDAEDLVTTNLAFPISIDLHIAESHIYWIDQGLGQIARANFDGSGIDILVTVPASTGLRGIEVDALNRKLYWGSLDGNLPGHIRRSNLDGSDVETVVTLDLPMKIAVDPVDGKIYWTDTSANAVRRSNLDGSGIEDLFFVGDDGNADGIALDLTEGKVYWGQQVQPHFNPQDIMRMNLDGSDPEVVAGVFGIVAEIGFLPDAPTFCLGDIDGKGAVDVVDFLTLIATWGPCESGAGAVPCPADVNGDGEVDIIDLCVLLANWGPCPSVP